MTIEEVANAEFKPVHGMVLQGYTSAVSWLKLEVRPVPVDEPLILTVVPTFLDSVMLYWEGLEPGSGWQTQRSGDRVPLAQRPMSSLISFAFPLQPSRQQTYFLRIQTTSTTMAEVKALQMPEALSDELLNQVPQVFYYGLMLWILLWALSDFLIRREALVALFMVVQVLQIGFNFTASGYLAYVFPNSTAADMVLSVLVILVVSSSLLFHRVLLRPFNPNRWVLHLTDVAIAAGPVLLLLLWSGHVQQALKINGTLSALIPLLLLALAFTARQDHVLHRRMLRAVYLVLALSIWALILPILGTLEIFATHQSSRMAQGLVAAFLMMFVLFARSQQLQRESHQASIGLARTQQHLADQQRRYVEQTRFLDMLTHELKTPIGVLRITTDMIVMGSSQRERINRSIKTIADVIDRCRSSLQLEHAQMKPVYATLNLGRLMSETVLSTLEPTRIALTIKRDLSISTDVQLLKMILQNLLDNALKYSPTATPVTFVLTEAEELGGPVGQAGMAVTNTLPSNASPDPKAIFKKYYRGVGSSGVSGSGLGLYLVEQMVALLGGTVACSVKQAQISFCVFLPKKH